MGFDRHCVEIVTQTSLLTDHLAGADLTVPVPTCPGWNVSQLARHVDRGQRWARDIVTTRAVQPPSDVALRDLAGAANDDPKELSASLTEAAAALRATLTDVGPDAQMWCPVDGGGSAFYARRFAYETAMHRADAALALGVEYALDPDIAADAVDEWMELGPTSRRPPRPGDWSRTCCWRSTAAAPSAIWRSPATRCSSTSGWSESLSAEAQ